MSREQRERPLGAGVAARARGLGAVPLVAVALGAVAFAAVGCGGPILANPAPSHAPGPSPTRAPAAIVDPQPIRFPRDDGPHDRLTEWWYYTGHLVDEAGQRYGFELVVFRAERGGFPVSWASHLAVTDETGQAFHYAQRSEVGSQVDRSPSGANGPIGFELAVSGADPARPETVGQTPWVMRRVNGRDRIVAGLTPAEARRAGTPDGLGLDLSLMTTKPPALHDNDGWIDFGPAGESYYYSRTAMTARGSLELGGRSLRVTGTAWFDHQWGDFIAVGGGGWDWFAVNLADGTDVTVWLVRAADGTYPLVYGTLVDANGRARHLDRTEFTVSATGTWRSAQSGASYPAGWVLELPGERLRIDLAPTVADQELDTRETTGVVYWEGAQTVHATRAGEPLHGEAYVELTGYAR